MCVVDVCFGKRMYFDCGLMGFCSFVYCFVGFFDMGFVNCNAGFV